MNNWMVLCVAIILSTVFRVLPFIVGRKIDIKDNSLIIRFLEYTSLAIIGSIIYSVGFSNQGINELLHGFNLTIAIKLIVLVITFCFSLYQRNILLVFSTMVLAYALIVFFIIN